MRADLYYQWSAAVHIYLTDSGVYEQQHRKEQDCLYILCGCTAAKQRMRRMLMRRMLLHGLGPHGVLQGTHA